MAKIWRDEFGAGYCNECWAEADYGDEGPEILNQCENGHRMTGEDEESPYYREN